MWLLIVILLFDPNVHRDRSVKPGREAARVHRYVSTVLFG